MNKNHIFLLLLAGLFCGLLAGFFLFSGTGKETSAAGERTEGAASESEAAQIWTCSMHPQIRQKEPGLCPICEMELIPLSENTSDDPLVLQMTKGAAELARVRTTVVGTATAGSGDVLRLSGKVKADERNAFSQVAHVPGRIEKLYVTFTGEEVRKGQKLADIYSPQLVTAQQELLEALRFGDTDPELLNAARAKLRYWKIGEEAIRNIEGSGEIRETFPLFADAGGTVTERHVAVGDYVKQGEPLFEMMDLSRVWVLFDAYETDLARVSVGDRIEFTTPSLPGRTFRTRITFIDPGIDPLTRVAALRTEVANPGGLLKPEMFVKGVLQARAKKGQAIMVPRSAVLWTGTRSVVWVKVPGTEVPSYRFREVKLGDAAGDQYPVLSGLETGEEVVTQGNFVIDAAAQLNNQASMMNREVLLEGGKAGKVLPDFTEAVPPSFGKQLSGLLQAYLGLKDALVASDSLLAREKADGVLRALAKVEMELPDGDARLYWLEKATAIKTHGEQIRGPGDLAAQREAFMYLSKAVIQTIQAFGVSEDTYYVQFCPMANNDKGASWLSEFTEIRNPYFGDKMLKCGMVQDSFSATR